jgi:hypothetical protein
MAASPHLRTMSLGAFVHEPGQHAAAWRHPDACAEPGTNFPELQRRGLFRREYEGTTLRENLGLPYPPDRSHPAPLVAE